MDFCRLGLYPAAEASLPFLVRYSLVRQELNEKTDRYFVHKSSTCEHWSDENVVGLKAFSTAPRPFSRVDSDGSTF